MIATSYVNSSTENINIHLIEVASPVAIAQCERNLIYVRIAGGIVCVCVCVVSEAFRPGAKFTVYW